MKRFSLYCLALTLCVVVLAMANDVAIVLLARSSVGSPAYKMERLWHGYEKGEIPILGSSRAQGNFVPSEISSRCFDYGLDGMGLPEVVFLLGEVAKRNTGAPVIVNLDPWGFVDYDKPHFVGDYRLAPESGRCVGLVGSLPGLRFHGDLRRSLTVWLNERRAVTKVIDKGAVILRNSRTANEWKVINSKLTPCSFARNDKGEKSFEAALSALAPRKAVVVVGPCSSRFMELYHGGRELNEYLGHLTAIDNVVVVNLFGSSRFADEDFTDPTHLNISGAHKFTQMFRDVVRQVIE